MDIPGLFRFLSLDYDRSDGTWFKIFGNSIKCLLVVTLNRTSGYASFSILFFFFFF